MCAVTDVLIIEFNEIEPGTLGHLTGNQKCQCHVLENRKERGGKSTVWKNRKGKRGGRRLKNTAKNRKMKNLTKGKKRLKKLQKLIEAESVDQISFSVKGE